MIKLTFLGTGTSQGIPVVGCQCDVCLSSDTNNTRLRSSALIESKNTTIIIDTGPDLRQQLLRTSVNRIDAILYTHEHNDHVIGLDDIRPIYFNRKSNIPSYALARVNAELRQRFAYMFADTKYPGVAQIDTHNIDKTTASFFIGDIEITPIGIEHGRLEILGYIFNDKVAYITDASAVSKETIVKLQNVDCIIVNALRKETHHSHFNLDQAITFITGLPAKKGYITHVSHDMGLMDDILHLLPSHISIAYDGLIFEC